MIGESRVGSDRGSSRLGRVLTDEGVSTLAAANDANPVLKGDVIPLPPAGAQKEPEKLKEAETHARAANSSSAAEPQPPRD